MWSNGSLGEVCSINEITPSSRRLQATLLPLETFDPINPRRQLESIGDHPRLETIGSIQHFQAVMPSAIGGDLIKLVHPPNSFCKVDGAKPLQVGDVCKAEARIVSAIKANEGKGKKVIEIVEVVSSFLYHGRFVDCKTPFHLHQLMLH